MNASLLIHAGSKMQTPINSCTMRLALGVLGATLLFVRLALAAERTEAAPPAPPGKLVDVGGYRLHLIISGTGGPSVVLESGGGDFSFDWSLVQPEVARFTQVVSYDRAGYAFSDPGPKPRTMRQIATELHTALHNANVKPPYVLVGHSFGGLIIRVFAEQYRAEVAGMVLVDSTHEDTNILLNNKWIKLRASSRNRAIPAVQLQFSPPANPTPAETTGTSTSKSLGPPFDKLPPHIQKLRLWATALPNWDSGGARQSEFDFLPEELSEMYSARRTQEYPLGDLPLIALRRKKIDEQTKRNKEDLLKLSRNSKQLISEEGSHHLHIDDPALVIDVIKLVVEALRQNRKLSVSPDI